MPASQSDIIFPVPSEGLRVWLAALVPSEVVPVIQGPDASESELLSWPQLPKGWDFGRGVPPSGAAVERGLSLYRQWKGYLESAPESSPGVNGDLSIVFDKGNEYFIEVTINADTSLDVSVEHGSGASFDVIERKRGVDSDYIFRLITDLPQGKECGSYGHSTYSTTPRSGGGSLAAASGIMGETFQFSNKSALTSEPQMEYATI
jgi:hypothetical protein